MPIKFKGDMTKVVAKNKGDMSKVAMRKRAGTASAVAAAVVATSTVDNFTKLLLHFDDSNGFDSDITVPSAGAAILSPDGTKAYYGCLSAYAGSKITVVNISNSSTTDILTPNRFTSLFAYNADKTKLYAYAGNNSTSNYEILVIDTATNTITSTYTIPGPMGGMAITPNNKYLFIAAGRSASGWASSDCIYSMDLTAANPVSTLTNTGQLGDSAVIISPDGTKLFSGRYAADGYVCVYTLNQATGGLTFVSNQTGFGLMNTRMCIASSTHAYYVDNNYQAKIHRIPFSTGVKDLTINLPGMSVSTDTLQSICLSTDGKKMYLPSDNNMISFVAVVNLESNTIISKIYGYDSPRGIVATSTKLAVGTYSNKVKVRSLSTIDDDYIIPSVKSPMQGVLSPDGAKVYMGTWGSTSTGNGLHVIDVATGTKTTTISTPGTTFDHVVNSTGTRVYSTRLGTTNGDNVGTQVYVFDVVNNTLLATVTVGSAAHSVAITPDDKFVFVSCETSGLYRIDTSTNSATNLSISTAKYAVEVSPDGTKLLFSNGSNVYVYSINTTTGAVSLLSTLTGFNGAYTSTKNSNYAYFLNNGAGTVTPVSWSTLTAETAITVGNGPYGACVSPDGKKLYVANNTGYSVSVVDTSSNKVAITLMGNDITTNSFNLPRGCVATNSKLFVCCNGDSTVYVRDVSQFADAVQNPLSQYKQTEWNSNGKPFIKTSTMKSKFGGKSLALDGTNTNKLQFANPKGKAMNLTNQPFCIEGWFYLTTGNFSGNAGLISWANTDTGDCQGVHIDLNASNRFEVYLSTNGSNWDLGSPAITTSVSPTLNTWFHLALIRETAGGDIKLVHNGAVIGTKVTTSSLYTGDYMYIAKTNYQNITKINGYIDDVRVVVGSCPYSSSAFVVPTAELTAITNTKVLLKGANVTKDDSSLNLYTQALGSAASSTVQSKFGGSSIKIASATGDFIKVANQSQPIAFFDRPFTIEGWFYKSGTGFQPIIAFANADLQGPSVAIQADGTISAAISTTGNSWAATSITSTTPSSNAWHHFALVRETKGGNIKLYHDGVLMQTTTTSAEIFTAETLHIGHYPYYYATNAYTFNGYIDEVRITLGYCAYNGNFTPATAPFTDGKNLLLHFDGANGSTTMTDSSTYGKTATAYNGAVISTTKSKFGGSSLYLPGTGGSRVTVANSSDFAFGTGDFTIEYWANLTALSTGYSGYHSVMIDTRSTNQNGWLICLNSTRKIIAYIAGANLLTSVSSLPVDQWVHVALVYTGGFLNLYLDGVLDSSKQVGPNATQTGFIIGANFDYATYSGGLFNGYIDELRVTKGTALYGGNFTPPTAPFALIG